MKPARPALGATLLMVVALLMVPGCGRPAPAEAPASAPVASGSPEVGGVAKGAPTGMVWIPGGEFWMGGPGSSATGALRAGLQAGEPMCTGLRDGFTDADPVHRVAVDGFWMDETEVTNDQFARFVAATGYRTVPFASTTASLPFQ